MAKEDPKNEPKLSPLQGVVSRNISTEMRESYLDYAMSVITARALPDVRDGLKPVHRRILYTMHQMGLHAGAKFRKSAAVIGDVMGKYHPHGDASIYEAMVKMAQDFTYRYPLVFGQGNFGCFTKDTKIELTDSRQLSFGELVTEYEKGKRHFTYTINRIGLVSIAEIKNPRITRKSAELVRVTLDNGEKIRCTPDHRFMLRDGSYKEARDLLQNESLMPLYQRMSEKTDRLNREGYTLIYQPKNDMWIPAHHLADNHNLTLGVYRKSAGRVRHHQDFNKNNNDPTNILRLSWGGHWKIHYTQAATQHKNPEYREKIAAGRKEYWSQPEIRKAYARRISERNLKNWQNPSYREKMRVFLSEVNKRYIAEHPEKRKEFSARATQTLKKLWKDPQYRSLFHEKIVASNKRRITNGTGKQKFLTICRELLKENSSLSAERYEAARGKLYPYGHATKWETGLQKYFQNEVGLVQQEARRNHRVIQVEALTECEDVYDLTIDGTHNFALASGVFVHNSVDGDNAAAMRYTEAKMSAITSELLRDLEKETVDWRPNYDGTKKEPTVMPSAVPNLLLNGTLGIAVGMATSIPPHNLAETIAATIHLIENDEATNEDLLQFVKGPDFPGGGLAFSQTDIRHAYANGKGPVVTRGEAEIVEDSKGNYQIIITSIPYRVNKADLITKIADLVREKKLEGIKDLRDESAKDTRIAIDLKNNAQPKQVLNYLYKHTQLEEVFHYNMVALVDGVPQTLSLKGMLEAFIDHRQEMVKKRTEFDLRQATSREHILLGLSKALDHIDEIVKLIRAAKDVPTAHAELMKRFKFSEIQATAILDMRLQKLAGLERKKIEDELTSVQVLIKTLKELLSSPKNILKQVKQELEEVGKKYGDERRTKIIKGGVANLSMEDVIAEEEQVLVLTSGGYVKRTGPGEYRKQKRGGVGVVDLNTKEEDFITNFLSTSTHSDILFFTDKGKVYQIKMYELPEGKRATRGKSVQNFLSIGAGEKVTSMLAMPKETKKGSGLSLLMVTKAGVVKKVAAEGFHDVRRSGLIAIKLHTGDELISASFTEKGDTAVFVTSKGQSIRFKESDIRAMGRNAAGVRAMKLGKGGSIVAATVVGKDFVNPQLLVVSNKGYGKRTNLKEYKVQHRGGSGIKTMNITPKTGELIGAQVVGENDGELVVMSKKGQVIRIDIKEVPSLSRATQGVRIMKLYEGDAIATLVCL